MRNEKHRKQNFGPHAIPVGGVMHKEEEAVRGYELSFHAKKFSVNNSVDRGRGKRSLLRIIREVGLNLVYASEAVLRG